jgi:hypothetical protein
MTVTACKLDDPHDPTVYPIEDDVGEGSLQRFISEMFRALVEQWLKSQGKPTFVGADQFFYWKQYDPSEGIAPDVYVLPGAPLDIRVGCWKTWEDGFVPSFVFEIVSRDIDKDYRRSPVKYARLGVEELVVFDPDFQDAPRRVRWQIFRKTEEGFFLVLETNADRVWSNVLGCHLRVVGEGAGMRVRIAHGPEGETLLPTDAEARERVEEALASERRARADLEAKLARLEAEKKSATE